MKARFKIFFAIAFIIFHLTTFGQSNDNKPFFDKYFFSPQFDYGNSLIIIDSVRSTYDELLNVKDTSLLKVEIYDKKTAGKLFGKDGKNGAVIVTRKTYKPLYFPIVIMPDSAKFFIQNNDTFFVKATTSASLYNDTTAMGWTRFIERNINPNVPADNGAPSGVFIVTVRFIINKDGSVSNIAIDEDPGYGTAEEVLRAISKSPLWNPALYNGLPVKSLEHQKVTFTVSDF